MAVNSPSMKPLSAFLSFAIPQGRPFLPLGNGYLNLTCASQPIGGDGMDRQDVRARREIQDLRPRYRGPLNTSSVDPNPKDGRFRLDCRSDLKRIAKPSHERRGVRRARVQDMLFHRLV